jgi:hypothetical protein
MKTKNILLISILIALLFSCIRDKDRDSGPAKNTHRIKQVTFDNDEGTDRKSVFTYDDKERLIMIMRHEKEGSETWKEVVKIEIFYNPAEIKSYYYSNESGFWEYTGKQEFYVEDGLLKEEWYYHYIDDDWVENSEWTYDYSGTNLIEWQCYFDSDNDGSVELNSKGEYGYINNKLDEYRGYYFDEFEDWIEYDLETFSYSGDKLSGYINYYKDTLDYWVESFKCTYIYTGDNITEAEYYDWVIESNDWEYDPFTVTYDYDINGYLIEHTDDDGDKTTYEYEAGNGNAVFFWYYPEDLVYGRPTLKSTTTQKKYAPYYERIRFHGGQTPF